MVANSNGNGTAGAERVVMSAATNLGVHEEISQKQVSQYYGEVLTTTEDLKTTACCDPSALTPKMKAMLSKLPDEVIIKYYGCGSPVPEGIESLRVLDLGCGSGRA